MSATRARDLGLATNGAGNSTSFASRHHGESNSVIPTKYWGENNLTRQSRTPWGEPQHITNFAPGIDVVDCEGHGGMKLSPERNKEIPSYARNRNGWYEEDCEYYIPSFFYPEETRPTTRRGYSEDRSVEEWKETAAEGMKNWHPDAYEKFTGETIPPGVSHTKDAAQWAKQSADQWHVQGQSTNADGTVDVSLRRGEERHKVRMTKDQYQEHYDAKKAPLQPGHDIIIANPEAYETVVDPPKPVKPPKPRYTGFDDSKVSPAKRDMVNKELNQRWRNEEGRTYTLRSMLEDEGITGKRVSINSGKREYRITRDDYSYVVSKALWDIAPAPDVRTRADLLKEQIDTFKLDENDYDFRARAASRQKYDKIRAEYSEAWKAEMEERRASQ